MVGVWEERGETEATVGNIFYLVLVFFSEDVHFSLFWFIVSLFFEGGNQVITRYRYTNDPKLDGTKV